MSDTPRKPEINEFVRGTGTLVSIEDVTPKPPPVPVLDYIFSTIDARTEIRRNGKALNDLGTLSDYYGLETSVATAIKEAREYADSEGITATSEVEVVVVRVVSYFRARPDRGENFYDKTFVEFKALDHAAKWNVPDDEETVVWSTKGMA